VERKGLRGRRGQQSLSLCPSIPRYGAWLQFRGSGTKNLVTNERRKQDEAKAQNKEKECTCESEEEEDSNDGMKKDTHLRCPTLVKSPAIQSKWDNGNPVIGGDIFGKENTGQSRNLRNNTDNHQHKGDLSRSQNFRKFPENPHQTEKSIDSGRECRSYQGKNQSIGEMVGSPNQHGRRSPDDSRQCNKLATVDAENVEVLEYLNGPLNSNHLENNI
ncbi:hypothetical protein U1Q18_014017, partial [Sarracenia purpurea var. burkii]